MAKLGEWDVQLPGLTRSQAQIIVGAARSWNNVLAPYRTNPKRFFVSYWNAEDVQAVLQLMNQACQTSVLTEAERSMCIDNFPYECWEWLERADMTVKGPSRKEIEGEGYWWDVALSYITFEQACRVVEMADGWSNVVNPHVIDGRRWMKNYWDYPTVRMMLDVVQVAVRSLDLEPGARLVGFRLIEEYKRWLKQAVAVEDEEGHWLHE